MGLKKYDRLHLIALITTLNDLMAVFCSKSANLHAVAAYYNTQEDDILGGRERSNGRPKRVITKKEESLSPEDEVLKAAMLSVCIKDSRERPNRSFHVLGQ